MSAKRLLESVAAVNALAAKLAHCPEVSRLDEPEQDPEAAVLAYTFSELEESFRRFTDDLLPRLLASDVAARDIFDLLHEIGEEFRHIRYHLRDTKFYSYLDVAANGDCP